MMVSVDTIPWGLLKGDNQGKRQISIVSVDTIPWGLLKDLMDKVIYFDERFQWILFLGAYLKRKNRKKNQQNTFQWILFLGAYLKILDITEKPNRRVSVDTIPWGLLKAHKFALQNLQETFQWILFLGAYLKNGFYFKELRFNLFQWILFLGAYLKRNPN